MDYDLFEVVGDWVDAPSHDAVRDLHADLTDEHAWRVFAEVESSCYPPELAPELRGLAEDPARAADDS